LWLFETAIIFDSAVHESLLNLNYQEFMKES